MVDLSFAGRQKDQHLVHRAIAEATVGDAIQLKMAGGRWQIEDMSGRVLGRMAKAFAPLGGTKFVSGQIAAIIRWRKDDADEKFHHMLRRDEWEVVVPDLVFEQTNV